MPPGTLDELTFSADFDPAGLTRGLAEALTSIDQFEANVVARLRAAAEVDVNIEPLDQSLRAAEARFRDFTATMRAGAIQEVQQISQELARSGDSIVSPKIELDTEGAVDAAGALHDALEVMRGEAVLAGQQLNQPLGQIMADALAQLQARALGTSAALADLATPPALELNAGPALQTMGQLQFLTEMTRQSMVELRALLARPVELKLLTSGGTAEDLATTGTALVVLEKEATALTTTAVATGTALVTLGAAAQQGGQQTSIWSRIVQAFRGSLTGLNTNLDLSTAATHKLRGGFTALALAASGTSPAVGQVVQGLLLIGGGSSLVLGAAAGIGILATAITLYEKPLVEAKKKTDDLIESLEKAAAARKPDFEQIGDQISAVATELEQASKRLQDLQRQQQAQGSGGFKLFGADVAKAAGQLLALGEQLQTLIPLQDKLREGARFTTIVDAAQLGIPTAATIRDVNAELVKQSALVNDTTLAQEKRNEAQRHINTLIDATLVGLERQLSLTKLGADAALATLGSFTRGASDLSKPFALTVDFGPLQTDLQRFRDEVDADVRRTEALATALNQATPAAKRLADTARDLRALRDSLDAGIISAQTAPFDILAAKATTLGQRLEALRGMFVLTSDQQRIATAGSVQLAATLGEVAGEIEAQGGPLKANLTLLQAQSAALRALGPDTAPFVAGLGLAITRLQIAQGALDEFIKSGDQDTQLKATLVLDVKEASAGVVLFQQQTQARLDASFFKAVMKPIEIDSGQLTFLDKTFDLIADKEERMGTVFGKFSKEVADGRLPVERLRDAIEEITAGASGIVNAAQGIGLIGSEAASAIDSVLALSDAIANVAVSASTGNVLGLVSSAINVIGSLFSEGESDISKALRENTDAIHQNTIDRATESFPGIGGAAEVANIIAQVISTPRGQADVAVSHVDQLGPIANAQLLRDLAALGLTFEELQRTAQDFGIQITSHGKLIGAALDDLVTEIRNSIAATLQFGNSLSEQVERQNLQSRLFEGADISDPRVQVQNTLDALKEVAPGIANIFSGVDLSSEPEFRKAMQELFTDFDTSFFKDHPELFGGLEKSDFLTLLNQGADYLDTFNSGLADVSKTLDGVPDTFKLAAAEFQAQTGEARPEAAIPDGLRPNIDPGALDSRPITDGLAQLAGGATLRDIVDALVGAATAPDSLSPSANAGPTPGSGVFSPPSPIDTGDGFFAGGVHIEEVNITVEGAGDPVLTGQTIKATLRGLSLATHGTGDRWGGRRSGA